jgi:hypothetical protein
MTWNSTDAPALKFEDLIHLMNERAVTGLLSTMPFNQLTNDLEAIQPIN